MQSAATRSTQGWFHMTAQMQVESNDRATETRRLLVEAQGSTPEAREFLFSEVVTLNLGVARSVARRFRSRGESAEDLFQVACVGLTKAVRGFDPSRGHDFLAYAVPTMSGEIKRHFRDLRWMIRPPRPIQELQAQISHATAELTQDLGRSPRPSEIAEHLGIAVDDITEALAADGCFNPVSLDQSGPHDDGAALSETLGERDGNFDRADAVAILRPACRHLEPRDQRILFLRFFRGRTQTEIAAELGLSQMQVSRLLSRILGSLREQLGDMSSSEQAS